MTWTMVSDGDGGEDGSGRWDELEFKGFLGNPNGSKSSRNQWKRLVGPFQQDTSDYKDRRNGVIHRRKLNKCADRALKLYSAANRLGDLKGDEIIKELNRRKTPLPKVKGRKKLELKAKKRKFR